jgi:hypothetical protein
LPDVQQDRSEHHGEATLSEDAPAKPALIEALASRDQALRAALVAAVVTGLGVVVLRVARKEPLQQAVSGFLGLGIAVFLAARSGEARDFFLPGIFINLGYAVLFLGSTLIGRPLVGVIYSAVEGLGSRWRKDRVLRRAFTVATIGWSVVFLSRAVVQTTFYNLDRTGWLATTKLLMGWPLTILAVAATVAYVKRARARGARAAR